MEGNKINGRADPVRQISGRVSKALVGRTVLRRGWRAPRRLLGGPGALPRAAATWEQRSERGCGRLGPPWGPNFYSSGGSEEQLGHVHGGDDLAVCTAAA